MSRILNSTDLIKSVRRRGMVPDDSSTFTNQDILDILNEEIDVGLLSTLLNLNEEYLVHYEEIDLVSGTNEYEIPYRAIGNKLRDVMYVDQSGGVYELTRVSLEDLPDFRYFNRTSNGIDSFYVQNNKIVLNSSLYENYDKLRLYFYLRPNKLVEEKYVGKITSIDTATGVVSLQTFPEEFTNIAPMDFIAYRTPNKILKYDITPTSANKNLKTVTFDPDSLPSGLIVGDYLAFAEETSVPNLPTELHPILAQRCSVHILESLGDTESLQSAQTRLRQMELAVQDLIDNRVEGAPQKIRNKHSQLQQTQSITRFNRRIR